MTEHTMYYTHENKVKIASLTVQSLTALKSSRHNSFNSFVAEGTWLYFLAEPGEDLQGKFQTKIYCQGSVHGTDKSISQTNIISFLYLL